MQDVVNRYLNDRNMIMQYVRSNKGRLIGVLVGMKLDDDKVHIGWSKCNKVDRFNKTMGTYIALNRAIRGSREQIASKICPALDGFVARVVKYFRVKEVVIPPV